jgi:DsbC/DsbD-like thiol-disulfide interchange protein
MTTTAKWTAGLCGLIALVGSATGAWAGGAWAGEPGHSQARLVQGELAGDTWSAGVQIDLGEGWKTYWRMPGEAGIAPHFDWSRSRNVAGVEVRWPAPGRYHDASGETIGYAHRVLFPLSVRPEDAARPVELALRLDYAVCKDICIPARVELSRTLTPNPAMSSAGVALIRQFEARVPQARAPGVRLERAHLEDAGGAPRLAVSLAGTAVDPSTEIFVENFDGAYFREPTPGPRSGDTSVFHLAIDDLSNPELLKGRTLRLTVVTATAQLVGDVVVE